MFLVGGEKMRLIVSLAIGIIAAGLFGVAYNLSIDTFGLLAIGWANLAYHVLED